MTIPTAKEAAEALARLYVADPSPAAIRLTAAAIRERDRAILDEAERDCWNLAALRKKVLGE